VDGLGVAQCYEIFTLCGGGQSALFTLCLLTRNQIFPNIQLLYLFHTSTAVLFPFPPDSFLSPSFFLL
jgi:hypothetical protein